MKSIIATYPDFQSLPRGVKAMLLVSESHFFFETKSLSPLPTPIARTTVLVFDYRQPEESTPERLPPPE